jgi:hypothetical protein
VRARRTGPFLIVLLGLFEVLIAISYPVASRFVATEGLGAGVRGPWAEGASQFTKGGAVEESLRGSCVAACGTTLSGGARTETELLGQIGEWSNPEALADVLNEGHPARGSEAASPIHSRKCSAAVRLPSGSRPTASRLTWS